MEGVEESGGAAGECVLHVDVQVCETAVEVSVHRICCSDVGFNAHRNALQPVRPCVCRCAAILSERTPSTSKRLSVSPMRKRVVNHILPLRPFSGCTCEVGNAALYLSPAHER